MEVPPKRPMSAFLLWFVENREKLVSEVGGTGMTAASRLAGPRWRALSPMEKGPFEARAAELKASYKEAFEAFKARTGESGRKRQRGSEEAEQKAGGKKARQAAPSAAAPEPATPEKRKKPQNAYWLWFADHSQAFFKELNGLPAHKVSKRAGERWKELSALERAPYVKRAQELKAASDKEKTVKIAATATGAPMEEDVKENRAAVGGNVPTEEAVPATAVPEPATPEKPKRPQNAYWLWFADHSQAFFKELNGLPAHKVSKRAGERWKELSALERAPYVEKAQELKAAYDKALEEKKAKIAATSTGAPMEEDAEEKEGTVGGDVPMDDAE